MVADAAAEGLALPGPEGRVAGESPSPREVIDTLGPPISSMVARLPSTVSVTLLKGRTSQMVPVGPPSALEPLSLMSMTRVSAYC
jgi:hypothetical protein